MKLLKTNGDLLRARKSMDDMELRQLSRSKNREVRKRVAENESSPLDVLERLSTDRNPEVRIAVAENDNTPVDVLARLADDPSPEVRYTLASSPPWIASDILGKLEKDNNPMVAARAQASSKYLKSLNIRIA